MDVFRNDPAFTSSQVQRVMDATSALLLERSRISAALVDGGDLPDSRIVARGCEEANQWVVDHAGTWSELLSVRLTVTADALRISLPVNRAAVARGLRMTSLFDYHRAEPAARLLLSGEQGADYRFTYAPVQMKIVDGGEVLLDGPVVDDLPTLVVSSDPDVLAVAQDYWQALLAAAVPCTEVTTAGFSALSSRQRQVVALLANDSTDEEIADVLGVSVRTVRYDVARVMQALGTRSRFAAGLRISQLEQRTAG